MNSYSNERQMLILLKLFAMQKNHFLVYKTVLQRHSASDKGQLKLGGIISYFFD